jgi:hypothetical protein
VDKWNHRWWTNIFVDESRPLNMAETATNTWSKCMHVCASTKGPPSAELWSLPPTLPATFFPIWTYLSNLWPKSPGPHSDALPCKPSSNITVYPMILLYCQAVLLCSASCPWIRMGISRWGLYVRGTACLSITRLFGWWLMIDQHHGFMFRVELGGCMLHLQY